MSGFQYQRSRDLFLNRDNQQRLDLDTPDSMSSDALTWDNPSYSMSLTAPLRLRLAVGIRCLPAL